MMPVYESRCTGCRVYSTYTVPIAERNLARSCPGCGAPLARVIESAPKGFVKGKFEPFRSIVDGSIITTERDMQEHNKRNGVVNLADGYDDKTVKEGNYGKKDDQLDAKERIDDIQEAIHDLNQGYKPFIAGAEDE
jgi:putative FmdB family regulatory protein